jgi:hypothetical protein
MSGKLTALTYEMDMVQHAVTLKWLSIVFAQSQRRICRIFSLIENLLNFYLR